MEVVNRAQPARSGGYVWGKCLSAYCAKVVGGEENVIDFSI